MKIIKALGLVLLFSFPVCAQSSEARKNVIPFIEARSDGGYVLLAIHAEINNHPVTLVFDTGADGVAVDGKYIKNARLIGRTRVTGVGGTQIENVVRTSVRIGKDTFSNVIVTSQSTDVSKDMNTHTDGLLGENILMEYSRITIDYKTKQIILER
ncbi:MAG: retroviral-like aspartic protease family protein [Thaumarchaeota archaeon]|nr:retroviral-like aspartic protease family protein [Nitrososphaerota archaeon]